MTIAEIIKAVRWCIDEESCNNSDLADVIDEKDDSYMDNIIKAKIEDALHWISITVTSSLLLSDSSTTKKSESTTTDSTTTTDTSTTTDATSVSLEVKDFDKTRNIGKITMPDNLFVFNINRVRCNGWYKAVIPVEDTSDDALLMYDETAMGSVDRPLATIMREEPITLLLQPKPTDSVATISYVGIPTTISKDDESGEESVEISDKYKSAFIYYIAFLLLSAYSDTNATTMYNIALQHLGASQSK